MTKKIKSLNLDKMASIVHQTDKNIKVKDAKKTLSILVDIMEMGLDSGQEVKFGDLLKVYMKDYPAREQYNPYGKTEAEKHKHLPPRKQAKVKPLKRLQKIEKESRQ